jgi:alpha-beta hydrolase superfamily lysophospholipase
MGEHGGRYFHVPHYLQDVVDAVYCLDLRGHGRSEGLRGHVERFDCLADDVAHAVRRFEEQLRKRFGRAELHLLGHSLGGHLVLRTLFLHPDLPLLSATASAPFLGIKAKVPAVKKLAAHALSRVWGSLQLSTGIDVSGLSRDKGVCDAYLEDRLVHDKMTPQFFTGMQAAFSDTLGREDGIRVPLQILVPLQDPIVDPEKSLAFFRGLKHRDKQLKTYPGFYHEPLNELGKEQVFADLADWIRAHPGAVAE